MAKHFAIPADEITRLISREDGCIASDRITVDGRPVGYMYREKPRNPSDSGWAFFAGDETDEYTNNPDNFDLYQLNTIANYDADIIPLLDAPIGSAYIRNWRGRLVPDRQRG